MKLDSCSDEIIQSIESAKENCVKMLKESKRRSTEIEQTNEELTDLVDSFDTFEIDNEKFERNLTRREKNLKNE